MDLDFRFFSIGIGNTELSKEYIVEVKTICDEVFDYADNWIKICHYQDLPKWLYYDGNNKNDKLLYKRMCEDNKSEHLLKQHNQELERRSE